MAWGTLGSASSKTIMGYHWRCQSNGGEEEEAVSASQLSATAAAAAAVIAGSRDAPDSTMALRCPDAAAKNPPRIDCRVCLVRVKCKASKDLEGAWISRMHAPPLPMTSLALE